MSLDPQVAAYLERLKASGAPPPGEVPLEQLRLGFEAAAAGLFGPVDPAEVEDRHTDGGIAVRVYRPAGMRWRSPALVYIHGGGWVNGSLDSHDGVVRALVNRSGCVAVA